ncbi:hypothetical protein [Aureibacter tunicatorum]|uniref:Uncharacterized protein n=1 Tax=Aureibacter tunicatorum TaxID=866807 RepID=A0AAE4BSM8_9BACT|nr:hypothetical protein [Aureibacter tunicatorum]MDR6238587.1 hypothetical protein [Aureibacter tunicatorum]BDD05482.1 hypothetical protein AUTU_29650 [Aureibacter tunicatorum]
MRKSIIFLKFYAISSSLLIALLIFSGFKKSAVNQKFDEITVERINVVEADGSLKMVISNSDRQHNGLINGKEFPDRVRPSGIIFFSEEDEIGGLIFGGDPENGNSLSLTTDKFKNDQVMQLSQSEYNHGEKSSYGLTITERPSNPGLERQIEFFDSLRRANANPDYKTEAKKLFGDQPSVMNRVFLGKSFDDAGGLWLYDRNNKPRLLIYVDADNNPHMEVWNENGEKVKDFIQD